VSIVPEGSLRPTGAELRAFSFLGAPRNELNLGPVWLLFTEKGEGKHDSES
jgi:hypothetical protein